MQNPIKNNILELYGCLTLEKAIVKEWRSVVNTKTGKIHNQRYGIRNDADDEQKESLDRSVLHTELKDRLFYSTRYNGRFYDADANEIHIPERLKDSINEKYGAQFSGHSNPENKAQESRDIIENVKKKDKIKEEIEQKWEEKYNKEISKKTRESYIEDVYRNLDNIDEKNNSINILRSNINFISEKFKDKNSVMVILKHNNTNVEVSLNDLISRLEASFVKNSNENKAYENNKSIAGLKGVEIKDLDKYNIEDFKPMSKDRFFYINNSYMINAAKKAYKKEFNEEVKGTFNFYKPKHVV